MTGATAAVVWGSIFAVGLMVEAYTLTSKRKGDTLSEQVWKLLGTTAGKFVLYPFWTWLTYHFFFDIGQVGVADDLVAIAAGLLLAYVRRDAGALEVRQAAKSIGLGDDDEEDV